MFFSLEIRNKSYHIVFSLYKYVLEYLLHSNLIYILQLHKYWRLHRKSTTTYFLHKKISVTFFGLIE